jgi:hypothetical protein
VLAISLSSDPFQVKLQESARVFLKFCTGRDLESVSRENSFQNFHGLAAAAFWTRGGIWIWIRSIMRLQSCTVKIQPY